MELSVPQVRMAGNPDQMVIAEFWSRVAELGTEAMPATEELLDQLSLEGACKGLFADKCLEPVVEMNPALLGWATALKQRAALRTAQREAAEAVAAKKEDHARKMVQETAPAPSSQRGTERSSSSTDSVSAEKPLSEDSFQASQYNGLITNPQLIRII